MGGIDTKCIMGRCIPGFCNVIRVIGDCSPFVKSVMRPDMGMTQFMGF